MISLLKGIIQERVKDVVVILTSGGVGYEVHMSRARVAAHAVGEDIFLYTYLKVSDSDQSLYGFETKEERSFFSLLMTVSGVGPKTALNILSLGSIEEIQSAIGRGDVKYLTAVSGLGTKTAERLVVELKGKVFGHDRGSGGVADVHADVIEALVNLGYSRDEAKQAVARLNTTETDQARLVKQALQQIK